MRLSTAVGVHSAWAMGIRRRTSEVAISMDLSVRLHDASTCVALAIGFIKETDINESSRTHDANRSVALLRDALANLNAIDAGQAGGGPARRSDLREELTEHAARLGLQLSLRMVGTVESLSPAHLELIRLTGREALVNTSRHAGTRACEITLDVSRCPYQLQARDWGQGIGPQAGRGGGLLRLRHLAAWLGAELVVASRSGLGTEIVLNGPPCPTLATSTTARLTEEASS